jgi:hypothetical protein
LDREIKCSQSEKHPRRVVGAEKAAEDLHRVSICSIDSGWQHEISGNPKEFASAVILQTLQQ